MNKLQELKNQLADVTAQIQALYDATEERDLTDEELAEVKSLIASRDAKRDKIATIEAMATSAQDEPKHRIEVKSNADLESYHLGSFMQDITKHKRGNEQARVVAYQKKAYHELEVQAAATGASESVPSDGGFLVGSDMTDQIRERAYETNILAPRADNYDISTNANSIEILANSETSRANGSRRGGVRHYWTAEAEDQTASKPTWRKAQMRLNKGGVLFYATDELIADAALLERKVTQYVGEEIAFAVQDAMINGDGVGKPLGILESGALVSVAKETGQAADTINYENTVKMYARFLGSDANALWIGNRDIFPQLAVMNLAVGTGGAPVWIPANGAAGAPMNMLHGYPLVFVEQCPTLGDKGDLVLGDWSQYLLAGKGGVQAAMSIHVEFVADEVVYRWIHRIDGQPSDVSAITPYKGSATRSPFVALAARA